MDYPIAIKSHKRVVEVQEKTLRFLARCGVGTKNVHFFVSTPSQADLYSRIPGFEGKVVLCEEPGVSGANNTLRRHWPKGMCVLQIDDDIEEMFVMENKGGANKLVPATNLGELAAKGFELCALHETITWGIYPVCNPFFMRPGYTTGLRFIWGSFNGFVSEGADFPGYKEKVKEDFEGSVDIFQRYGAVIRFNDYCVKTRFLTSAGGTGSNPDNIADHVQAARNLAARYPNLVRLRAKKSFGGVDVRLVDPKSGEEDAGEAEEAAPAPKKDKDPTAPFL